MDNHWDPLTDMPDLRGRVIVVTGGSSGVGFATVSLFMRRGAKVYFTTRDELKARKTKELLRNMHPEVDSDNIDWLILDLCDLKSIDAAAAELKRRERKVDILINNAAASTASTELVAGRWEVHMAANHAGPFLLANRLLPLLTNALKAKDADVRIINLSSLAHVSMLPRAFKFHFDSATCLSDPVPSYPWQWRFFGRFMFGFDMIRYAVSKAAVVLFTKELQRRLDEQNIPLITIAVHPGEVATEGVMAINNAFIRTVARFSFITAEQGAATPTFAATAKQVRQNAEQYRGRFLVPVGKVEVPNTVVEDDRQVEGLWDNTTVEINKRLIIDNLPPLAPW
ncbi:hypothetical protein BDV26DRAFT_294131 [Aspergillus bertholletiae]|uniref:NAD(P)-binding protein n=1 Tax=Aspergillus bertholletiae TaxID=1226010 RepID=A0A5N7B2X9_9EURO|nr:hypothetical protein BDV26DRAFT_294131 [Aspergillus bertholletiae]